MPADVCTLWPVPLGNLLELKQIDLTLSIKDQVQWYIDWKVFWKFSVLSGYQRITWWWSISGIVMDSNFFNASLCSLNPSFTGSDEPALVQCSAWEETDEHCNMALALWLVRPLSGQEVMLAFFPLLQWCVSSVSLPFRLLDCLPHLHKQLCLLWHGSLVNLLFEPILQLNLAQSKPSQLIIVKEVPLHVVTWHLALHY